MVWLTLVLFISILFIGSELILFGINDEDSILSSNNEGWEGSSRLRDALEEEGYQVRSLLSSTSLLHEEEDPAKTVLLSLGPQREYTLSEVHAIRKFVGNGGRMVLADDGATNNDLSSRDDVTFIKGQLYDQNFVGNPDIVKMKVGAPFFDGFVHMNKPASLTFSSGRPLIASTTSAWVDRNGNGINDNVTTNQGEAQGIRYLAVITNEDFMEDGTGTSVFISDPSLFMNGMIGEGENLEFALALVSSLIPVGGKVIFDDSVHSSEGGEKAIQRGLRALVFITTDVNLKIIVGSISVLSLLAVGYLYESPRKPRHDPILERTGVAELIEPDLLESDLDELKRSVLDKIRVINQLSVEDFSKLDWDEIAELVGDDELVRFIRTGKYRGGTEKLLIEVIEWQRK
jgi:hypothetical protein